MTDQLYVVPFRQRLQHLRCKVAIAVLHLVEVLYNVATARLHPLFFGFSTLFRLALGLTQMRHQLGRCPAQGCVGVHSSRAALLLKLVSH